MMRLLTESQHVSTESSAAACIVGPLLGRGGQGEVYRAGLEGRSVALKWYFPQTIAGDRALRDRLRTAIRAGSPSARFIWPLEIAIAPGVAEFGYIMREREGRFVDLAQYWRDEDAHSFRTVATIGFELAHNFLALHGRGLCYADINDRNVFVDPDSGDIAICDNDNVTSDGHATAIAGTVGFRAPEIATGSQPGIASDLHALAVLLFLVLVRHHPFEGRLVAEYGTFDAAAQREIYESRGLFIFDPANDANALGPEHRTAHACWSRLPLRVRELFVRAFTAGFRDSRARVTEGEWRRALLEARDAIYYCTGCGAENVYDSQRGEPGACIACALPAGALLQLHLERQRIVLNTDSIVFAHHVDPAARFDFATVVGRVEASKKWPGVYGLKNVTTQPWRMRGSEGDWQDVVPGRRVRMAPGTTIDFGASCGTIVV
jgi:DNA-binding helix-hairpin-helix protein with protein kinase domain